MYCILLVVRRVELNVYFSNTLARTEDGKVVQAGGVVWAIKKGIAFDAMKLLREVNEYLEGMKVKQS